MLTYVTRYMEHNTYPLASDKARKCKPQSSKKRKSSEAKQKDGADRRRGATLALRDAKTKVEKYYNGQHV